MLEIVGERRKFAVAREEKGMNWRNRPMFVGQYYRTVLIMKLR